MTDLFIGLGFSAALVVLLSKWKVARKVVIASISHPLSKSVIIIGKEGGGDMKGRADSEGVPSGLSPSATSTPNGLGSEASSAERSQTSGNELKPMSTAAHGYAQEEESEEHPYLVSRR